MDGFAGELADIWVGLLLERVRDIPGAVLDPDRPRVPPVTRRRRLPQSSRHASTGGNPSVATRLRSLVAVARQASRSAERSAEPLASSGLVERLAEVGDEVVGCF